MISVYKMHCVRWLGTDTQFEFRLRSKWCLPPQFLPHPHTIGLYRSESPLTSINAVGV